MSHRLRQNFFVCFVMVGVVAVVLSGCGGGGDTPVPLPDGGPMTGDGDPMIGDGDPMTGDGDPMTGDDDPMTGDDDPMTGDGDPMTGDGDPMMTVGLGGGLTQSPQPPVYADSGQDTLANLLPGGEAVFSPLSSTIHLDYGMDEAAQPEQGTAYVKSISSDGAGGFHVISVFNGEESRVHLEADDYSAEFSAFLKTSEDEQSFYYFTSWGSSEFDYFHFGYWLHYEGSDATAGDSTLLQGETYDTYVTYGARTDSGRLPAGSAVYVGTMGAGWWDAEGDPDSNLPDRYLQGTLSLEANFDDATISGRVDDMAIPSWSSDSGEDEPVGAIGIAATTIDKAQFIADWVGENTDVNAAPDRTLSGFTGTILGEFYGPAAEEVSGVLSGRRAATGATPERFIIGSFGASQPEQ